MGTLEGILRLATRSGLFTGTVALALLLASARSMESTLGPRLELVVFLGTVGIYRFDRWAHARAGAPWWVLPAGLAVPLGLALPTEALAILAGVCALALLHVRLRDLPWAKPLYIALAWLAVVVGLPWVFRGGGPVPGVVAPLGLAIVANVLACDAVDSEAEAARLGARQVRWIARAVALAGVLVSGLTAEALFPAFMLAALAWPLRDRAQAEIVLDGALLAAALAFLVIASG